MRRKFAFLFVCASVFNLALVAQDTTSPGGSSIAGVTPVTPTDGPADLRTGVYGGRPVTYRVVDGLAIYEGDIILGPAEQLGPPGNATGLRPRLRGEAFSTAYTSSLWPLEGSVHVVPYTIVNGAPALANSIAAFNSIFTGLIQFQPRAAETYYVQFNFNAGDHSGTCEANVGYNAAFQPEMVSGSIDCNQGVILHEMGHIAGLWHEQARPDRNQYVTVNYGNVIKGSRSNFDQVLDNSQTLGPYDYGSVMHYIPFAFSRNGGATLESIPAGIPLSASGPTATYTASDIDGIKRLYSRAPATVTIATDPPGLQVIVDGSTVTTPQVYNWALNSAHTLNVPSGIQTSGGSTYTFGRWNNTAWTGTVQPSQSITVTPGSGLLTSPASSPAITVYTGAFTQLIHYTPQSIPAGGSIATNPLPQTIGASQYFTARQPVTLTATPPGGNVFYSWFGSFDGIIPFGLNPMTTPHLLDNDIGAQFTNSTPITTVGTNPANAGLGVTVDGTFYYSPKNFNNAEWLGSGTHTLNVSTPQQPYSSDTRFIFADWNGNPANPLIVNSSPQLPAYTANFSAEYRLTKSAYPSCAGTVNVSSPPNGAGFYANGTSLTISETPAAGWTFVGWKYDLTGTAPSQMLTMSDEELVEADFNTVNTPLAITGLSTGTVQANSPNFTLTLTGTGFDPTNSIVFVNGVYTSTRQSNVHVLSSTQMTIPIYSTDLTAAGAVQILIENFPPGAPCAATATAQLFVSNGSPTVVSVTPVNGSGSPQTFNATYSDPAGPTDLNAVYLIFSASLSAAHSCAMLYVPSANGLYLYNDAGTGFVTGSISPGTAGTLTNSQCTIGNAGAATTSGINLTLPVAITFSGTFSGVKNIYAIAANNEGMYGATWQVMGTWTPAPSQAPTASVSPTNGSGAAQPLTAIFTEQNGVNDLNAMYVVLNSTLSTAHGCLALYLQASNSLYLYNDAGNGFVGGTISPGAAGSLSNSQCTVSVPTATTITATTLTLPLTIAFTTAFSGTKNVYAFADNYEYMFGGVAPVGTWTPAPSQAPTVASVTPINGSGSPMTFNATYGEQNAVSDLNAVYLLFNSTLSVANACAVIYVPPTNAMYLYNDTGSGFVAGTISPGTAGTLSNGQCTISTPGSTTVTGVNLTLPVSITFAAGFTGVKNVYGFASNFEGGSSGWRLVGGWVPH